MQALDFLNSIPPSIIVLLSLVDLGLRGWALWKAARKERKYWFVALLLVNSLGLLPLVYLAYFDKKEPKNSVVKLSKKTSRG